MRKLSIASVWRLILDNCYKLDPCGRHCVGCNIMDEAAGTNLKVDEINNYIFVLATIFLQ